MLGSVVEEKVDNSVMRLIGVKNVHKCNKYH